MGDRFGESGCGGSEEGAGRDSGSAMFLWGGGRVIGADLGGEAAGGVGDAGLEGAGLPPGVVMGATGRRGELGADGLGEAGGGGVEGGG